LKTSEGNMQNIIDATDISDLVLPEFPEATGSPSEQMLGEKIARLWFAHVNAKNAARATNEELRALRAKLGEQLCRMKGVLAKPGCDGQWSGFLREHNIPRATADRLVARHQRSLNPDENCVTEDVSEPTEEEVQRLFIAVWPRLRRTLRSRQSRQLFVDLLTSHFKSGEPTVHEIPVVAPAAVTVDPPSSDGDSSVEPEFCSSPPPASDRATICAS
jgi:hypothetical protein